MESKRFLLFCLLMLEEAIDQLADLEESRPQMVFFSISRRVLRRIEPMSDQEVEAWLLKNDFGA